MKRLPLDDSSEIQRSWVIYTLSDPRTNVVRYVGVTHDNPKKRYSLCFFPRWEETNFETRVKHSKVMKRVWAERKLQAGVAE